MADAVDPKDPPGAPEAPPSTGTVDERLLLPIERDWRFLYRLVALLLVGLIAAAFVGWKLKGLAAGCGSGLVRPGSTVIPPEAPRR